MKTFTRFMSMVALAIAAVAVSAGSASASIWSPFPGGDHVVFVQNDSTTGNQVAVYDRAWNGTLTLAGTYPTGGLGGTLQGSVVDHLASQGSLTYDRRHGLLYAVNAGSNSITVFAVVRDRLFRLEVLPSGGTFPVSVAVHGDLVYVLNARDGGSVQGYRVFFGHVFPINGSGQALGLDTSTFGTANEFTHTPGQVAFSPDGSRLLVTTKAIGSVDVFGVRWDGRLTAPVVDTTGVTVPFAINWDTTGNLVIADAGTNALATFTLNADNTLTPITSVGTGAAATCWVATANGYLYASNAGSGTVSTFQSGAGGALTLIGSTPTDGGTVDASPSSDGRFLYVQTGLGGIVDEFAVGTGGSLTSLGSVTVANAIGAEGIAAA